MPHNSQTILAFDLYGTLLSTTSIAQALFHHFGDEKASNLAALWRRYQLEYTWRLNSMDQYQPFSSITHSSFVHALADSDLFLDATAIASVMEAYDSLRTFPDVSPALKALSDDPDITPVVFSNGTNAMVTQSVQNSPDLGPHASIFKDVVTVEEVRCFKPDPRVYYLLAERMGVGKEEMRRMWLVSGNAFDVVGARAVGMRCCWIDREGRGWKDELMGEEGRPDLVVGGLGEVVSEIKGWKEGL